MDKRKYDIFVGAFYSNGQLVPEFQSVPGIKLLFFSKKHQFDFLWIRKLNAFLRAHPIDIIEAWNTSAKTVAMIMARLFSISHTVVRERSAHYLYTGVGSVLYTILEIYLTRYASLVLANSQAGRQFAISKGIKPEKVRVIYNGIDAGQMVPRRSDMQVRAEFGINGNDPVVGMVARLIPEKDPATFLKAAKLIVATKPDVKFFLVGDGPLFKKLKDLTQMMGLERNVIFTGRRGDVPDLLNIMDIVVLSSSVTEGCSNVIAEAMFMAKPVIATDVGGNNELLTDRQTGFLVSPQKPGEMARAVDVLLSDSNLAKRMGKQAQMLAKQRFSFQNLIQQHEQVYKNLIACR